MTRQRVMPSSKPTGFRPPSPVVAEPSRPAAPFRGFRRSGGKGRARVVQALSALAVLASASAFAAETCDDPTTSNVSHQLFLRWAFAASPPYDRTFRVATGRLATGRLAAGEARPKAKAVVVGPELIESFDLSFVMEYLVLSHAPKLSGWFPVAAVDGEPEARLEEIWKLTERNGWRPNLVFLLDAGKDGREGVFAEGLRARLAAAEGTQAEEVDAFQPVPGCRIERHRAGREIRNTLGTISARLDNRQRAACMMTTVMTHYGFSDATAVFESDELIRGPRNGMYYPSIKYRPLYPLYGRRGGETGESIPLGATRCEAIEVLGR